MGKLDNFRSQLSFITEVKSYTLNNKNTRRINGKREITTSTNKPLISRHMFEVMNRRQAFEQNQIMLALFVMSWLEDTTEISQLQADLPNVMIKMCSLWNLS